MHGHLSCRGSAPRSVPQPSHTRGRGLCGRRVKLPTTCARQQDLPGSSCRRDTVMPARHLAHASSCSRPPCPGDDGRQEHGPPHLLPRPELRGSGGGRGHAAAISLDPTLVCVCVCGRHHRHDLLYSHNMVQMPCCLLKAWRRMCQVRVADGWTWTDVVAPCVI
jgi:hypothetical protein